MEFLRDSISKSRKSSKNEQRCGCCSDFILKCSNQSIAEMNRTIDDASEKIEEVEAQFFQHKKVTRPKIWFLHFGLIYDFRWLISLGDVLTATKSSFNNLEY